MFWLACFKIFFLTTVLGESTLRYTKSSCSSLEPSYEELTFVDLDLGPDYLREEFSSNDGQDEDTVEFIQPPKRLTTRNPPFQLVADFDQYRSNQNYKIRLDATSNRYADAFMVQVVRRGQVRFKEGPTNITQLQVGRWIRVPEISRVVQCGYNPAAAVVDKGRPILIGNLTFVWRSPIDDVGPIRVVGSVVYNNAYVKIDGNRGREIPFKSFPMSVKGCGRTRGCFRSCHGSDPNCPTTGTDAGLDYFVTMDTNKTDSSVGQNQILFKMGGKLKRRKENFIGIGLGKDHDGMRNTDIYICTRDGNRIDGGHYLLENSEGQPQIHRASIDLSSSGVDEETGFAFCSFLRPITPQSVYDLDLRQNMHQFYLTGAWNKSMSRPILDPSRVFTSRLSLNIAEPYNDIQFLVTDGSSKASADYKNNASIRFRFNIYTWFIPMILFIRVCEKFEV